MFQKDYPGCIFEEKHGLSIVLRNIEWKVPKESISMPIIGRRVLESLRSENRAMLTAARDQYGEEIDVPSRLSANGNKETEEGDGNIAAQFRESVFHNKKSIENDGLNTGERVQTLETTHKESRKVLEERMVEAVNNGLSKAGEEEMKTIIQKHKSVFKPRRGSSGPAKLTPMKIRLGKHKTPVKVIVSKYPAEQRKFVYDHSSKFVSLTSIKPGPQTSWQAARHLVPIDSKAKFRIPVDLHPVNDANIAEQWPMPMIEADLSNFKESECFASLDFYSGYCQCPLDA